MRYFLRSVCSPPSLLLLSLHSGLQPLLQNNVFFPHSQRIYWNHSFCDQLFMHYTSFPNNLCSHLSIFSSLPPSVSTYLFSTLLKGFHLLAMAHYLHSTQFLSDALYSFISSSPIFLLYHLSQLPLTYPRFQSPLSPPSLSSCPLLLKLNPVGTSLARSRLP